jgi:hypothetical protein
LWDKLKNFIHDETGEKSTSTEKIMSELARKDTSYESKEITVKDNQIKELKSEDGKGNTIIQKLEIRIDMNKLKDLPILQKLIDEIKDAQNSTDTATT